MARTVVVTLPNTAIVAIHDLATSQPGASERGSKYEDSPASTPKPPTLSSRILAALEKPKSGTDRLVGLLLDDAITLRDWCNATADKLLRAERPDRTRVKTLQDVAKVIETEIRTGK